MRARGVEETDGGMWGCHEIPDPLTNIPLPSHENLPGSLPGNSAAALLAELQISLNATQRPPPTAPCRRPEEGPSAVAEALARGEFSSVAAAWRAARLRAAAPAMTSSGQDGSGRSGPRQAPGRLSPPARRSNSSSAGEASSRHSSTRRPGSRASRFGSRRATGLDPVTVAVIDSGPMATPARLAANRQNMPPETGRPAADLGAIAEAIAAACLAAPAVIRRLLALARSAGRPVARAACGDLLQVRSLPDDVRAELLDANGLSDGKLLEIHARFLTLHASPDPQEKALALKALDMAYRLKGAYTPAREDGEVSLYALVRKMTVEELEDFLERKIFPERRSTTSGHTSISPEIADIRRTRLYPRRRRARQAGGSQRKGCAPMDSLSSAAERRPEH